MGEYSKIEWTDHTFNPWVGCTNISPGCDHCYAESWAKRSGLVRWGNHARRRTSVNYWKAPLVWNGRGKPLGEPMAIAHVYSARRSRMYSIIKFQNLGGLICSRSCANAQHWIG